MEENIITDRKLLKYIPEEDIKKISELFCLGKFKEIIETYFKKQKTQKNESINLNLLKNFDSLEHLDNNNNFTKSNTNDFKIEQNYFSKSNNDLININADNNYFSNDSLQLKNNFNSSTNLQLIENRDFILNTPIKSNNDIFEIKMDNKNQNNNPYLGNIGIIEDYYNSTNDEKEMNYELIDNYNDDKYTKQIILTIVIYCLMKIKNDSDLRTIIDKYNISANDSIFPLILLKAKFYYKLGIIGQCLDIYSEAINKYNDFKDKNNNDINSIIYTETYKQDFIYFNNLFNYLFSLNSIDSKIKKLYYEQKFCFYQIGYYPEGFNLCIELFNKYPNDVQIQFEVGKDSILLSKYDVYKEMLDILQASINQEKNENKKLIYMNYFIYLQGLSFLAQEKIENARNCFTQILKNDTSNVVVMNNNALLSLYNNKSKESFDILNLIENPNQMNSYNECIHENINVLKQKYCVNLQLNK